MRTPYERIAEARSLLVDAGLSPDEAAFDAEVLARHALGWDRARLLADGRDPAPPGFDATFEALITRRANREPVSQILGRREFWGLDFDVTRDVLTPRPETELVIEEALAFAREHPCHALLDVGTGSGCIALSVAHEVPGARVVAVDISDAALAVARGNAQRLGLADRVHFQHADLLAGIEGPFDLVLSNPPYMRADEATGLQPEVARFEPHSALFAGDDGLAVIRPLLAEVPRVLAPGGRLILEFGMGQDAAVAAAAQGTGWTVVRIRHDLQGIPRTAVLTRAEN